jgi:hypothetical protein
MVGIPRNGGNGGFAVDLIGFDDVVRRLTALADDGTEAVADALHEELQEVMDFSRDVLCPEETGRLRETAYLSEPKVRKDGNIQFVMSYGTDINGTEPAPYALFVHEDLEASHEEPTQAKFLESALEEAEPGFSHRVGVRVRTRFRDVLR